MQDSVDKLLSGFDKENEALRKSKALSEFDRERRERRDGMRLLTNVDTNQITRLPDIHTQYSKVVTISVNLIVNWNVVYFSLCYRKPWHQLPGWMAQAQAPPIRRDLNYPWT